jgi:hypothetical protein
MSLPITNNVTISNQNNNNLGTKKTSIFLNFKVSAINPTNTTQNQAETPQISQTNISNRLSTPASSLAIEPFNMVTSSNKNRDYFMGQITSLYKKNNVELKDNLKTCINIMATRKSYIKNISVPRFLSNVFFFMSEAFKKGYNEIFNITDAFTYMQCDKVNIRGARIKSFVDLTDKQVQELAGSKDTYRCLRFTNRKFEMSFSNIKDFIESRRDNNQRQVNIIYKIIDTSRINDSQKSIIKKHAENILGICHRKNIDIDTNLQAVIKNLCNLTKRTDEYIIEVLNKIHLFFECFDDDNTVIDTSILTNIFCYDHGRTTNDLLASICNITDKQIQFITSCKSKYKILEPWNCKGLPETAEIEQRISQFKNNNTNDKSADISVGCSNTQPIDSQHIIIILGPEQTDIDDISKELDRRMKVIIDNNTSPDDLFVAECLYSSSAAINSQDTDDNSTKVSTSYSNLQPDIIDLINTENNKEDFDNISKKIDDMVKNIRNIPHKQTTNDNENSDELWNIVKELDDSGTFTAMNPDAKKPTFPSDKTKTLNPKGKDDIDAEDLSEWFIRLDDESNSLTKSNTKRSLSLDSEKHRANKIPKNS